MAGTAVRAGLLAAMAGVLIAGGVADATETPPMTKPEAKEFKKEITAKLKSFEAKVREIQAEEDRRYEDEVGVIDSNQAMAKANELAADAARQKVAAMQEFLDAIRDCADAANANDPHHAEATAGSVIQATVAKGNATLAKEGLQTDAGLRKMQAEARVDCTPVAIQRNPGTLECNYLPPGPVREAVSAGPEPEVFICDALMDGHGELVVIVASYCKSLHQHTPECQTPGIKVELEDEDGTHEILGEAVDGVFDATLAATWSTHPSAVITVSNTTGRGFVSDTVSLSCPAAPPELPLPCDVPTASYAVDEVLQAVDAFASAVRIMLEEGVSFFGNFSDYDPEDVNQLSIGVWVPAGTATSGKLVVAAVTGPSPQTGAYARVKRAGIDIEGTLTILDMDPVVNPVTTEQLRARFVSSDGQFIAEFCIPAADIDTST